MIHQTNVLMTNAYLIIIIHFFNSIVNLHDICTTWVTGKVRKKKFKLHVYINIDLYINTSDKR